MMIDNSEVKIIPDEKEGSWVRLYPLVIKRNFFQRFFTIPWKPKEEPIKWFGESDDE